MIREEIVCKVEKGKWALESKGCQIYRRKCNVRNATLVKPWG